MSSDDVTTANLIENWFDKTERRSWFLSEIVAERLVSIFQPQSVLFRHIRRHPAASPLAGTDRQVHLAKMAGYPDVSQGSERSSTVITLSLVINRFSSKETGEPERLFRVSGFRFKLIGSNSFPSDVTIHLTRWAV
jgi:hypothetical protein